MNTKNLTPRDVVKLAFQYQETTQVPYQMLLTPEQEDALKAQYGGEAWFQKRVDYLYYLSELGLVVSKSEVQQLEGNCQRDILGCTWDMGSTHHLVGWPLQEPRLGDYRLPDLRPYYERDLYPAWEEEIAASKDSFRIGIHVFGLFERAWSLRGFENWLMDLALEEKFAEELLDHITEWILQSIDLMAAAPIDAVLLTDDHAAQRGMIMGAERWRKLFKPRWREIFDRVHHYGLYTILHMCGDNHEVIPDLIEVGLDCMESCQPECMDIYALKKEYGRDIRFWGGLGVQQLLPFGTPEEIKREAVKLKQEMSVGGGYILSPAKPPDEKTPVENIAAFIEEATALRSTGPVNA